MTKTNKHNDVLVFFSTECYQSWARPCESLNQCRHNTHCWPAVMLCKWTFVEGWLLWIWACAFDNLHYQGIKQMLMCSVSLHTSPELIWWPNFSWWKRSALYLLINLNSTILLGGKFDFFNLFLPNVFLYI